MLNHIYCSNDLTLGFTRRLHVCCSPLNVRHSCRDGRMVVTPAELKVGFFGCAPSSGHTRCTYIKTERETTWKCFKENEDSQALPDTLPLCCVCVCFRGVRGLRTHTAAGSASSVTWVDQGGASWGFNDAPARREVVGVNFPASRCPWPGVANSICWLYEGPRGSPRAAHLCLLQG